MGFVMKTQNTLAMLINPDQSVSIGTELINSKLTINNSSLLTSTLRLSYQDNFFLDSWITANGSVIIEPSCNDNLLDPDLTVSFKKNLNIIKCHQLRKESCENNAFIRHL